MITLLGILSLQATAFVVQLTGRDSVLNSDNTRTNYMYFCTMLVDKPFPAARYKEYHQSTVVVDGKEYKSVLIYDTRTLAHIKDIVKDSKDLTADRFDITDELKRHFFRKAKDLGYRPIDLNFMIDKE